MDVLCLNLLGRMDRSEAVSPGAYGLSDGGLSRKINTRTLGSFRSHEHELIWEIETRSDSAGPLTFSVVLHQLGDLCAVFQLQQSNATALDSL